MNNSFNNFLDYATSRLEYIDQLDSYIEKRSGVSDSFAKWFKKVVGKNAPKAVPRTAEEVARAAAEAQRRELGTLSNLAVDNQKKVLSYSRDISPKDLKTNTVTKPKPLSTNPEDINLGIARELNALDNTIRSIKNTIPNAPDSVKASLQKDLREYQNLRKRISKGEVPVSYQHAVLDPGASKYVSPGTEGFGDVIEDATSRLERLNRNAEPLNAGEKKFSDLTSETLMRDIGNYAEKNPDLLNIKRAPRDLNTGIPYASANPAYANYMGLFDAHRRAYARQDKALSDIYKDLMAKSEWGMAEAGGPAAMEKLLNKYSPKMVGESVPVKRDAISYVKSEIDENERLFRDGLISKEQYNFNKVRLEKNMARVNPTPVANLESALYSLDLKYQRGAIKKKDYRNERIKLEKQLEVEKARAATAPEKIKPLPEEAAPAEPALPPTASTPPEGPAGPIPPAEPKVKPSPAEPAPGTDPLPVNPSEKSVPKFKSRDELYIEHYTDQINKLQEEINSLRVVAGREHGTDAAAVANAQIGRLEAELSKAKSDLAAITKSETLPPTAGPITEPAPASAAPEISTPPTKPSPAPAASEGPIPPAKPTPAPEKPVETPSEGAATPEGTPEVKPPFSVNPWLIGGTTLTGLGTGAYFLSGDNAGGSNPAASSGISSEAMNAWNEGSNAVSAENVALRNEVAALRNRPDMSQMSFLERLLFLLLGPSYLEILGGLTKPN